MINQTRGYGNYMYIASKNQKRQEIERRPMKKVQFEDSKT